MVTGSNPMGGTPPGVGYDAAMTHPGAFEFLLGPRSQFLKRSASTPIRPRLISQIASTTFPSWPVSERNQPASPQNPFLVHNAGEHLPTPATKI